MHMNGLVDSELSKWQMDEVGLGFRISEACLTTMQ